MWWDNAFPVRQSLMHVKGVSHVYSSASNAQSHLSEILTVLAEVNISHTSTEHWATFKTLSVAALVAMRPCWNQLPVWVQDGQHPLNFKG